jgi:hypothetical protein
MVSGILRVGGIAALIADAGCYVLATFYQENLKYVEPGQPVEVAFDLYPGQIFAGKVDSIWRANGVGQYLLSDEIPKFEPRPANIPQGQYAVKILLDDPDQSKFPIGAQGTAAIYVDGEHGGAISLLHGPACADTMPRHRAAKTIGGAVTRWSMGVAPALIRERISEIDRVEPVEPIRAGGAPIRGEPERRAGSTTIHWRTT